MVGKSWRVYVLNGRLAELVGKMVVKHVCLMVVGMHGSRAYVLNVW
jgi:hypothetical protein